MDIVQAVRDLWGSPTIDLFITKMNNCPSQYMPPLPGSESAGSECLGCIMGRQECFKSIPSDTSHSGSAEQGNDGHGLPMSDRTLLAQPSMVSNSKE
jgi:hypothetical protein